MTERFVCPGAGWSSMWRNTRGCPNGPSPPSQATVVWSTSIVSNGAGVVVVAMGNLRVLYGGRGGYDSDATHAFNLGPRRGMRHRLLTALITLALLLGGCATHLIPPGPAV